MPTSHGRSSTLSVALALGTVYIVWGSTYLAIAYVVDTLPPILSGGIRFTVAGSLLLAFILAQAWWRRRRAPASRLARPRLVEWRTAAVVGTFLLLEATAWSRGGAPHPVGIAAVIIATVPIWMSLGEAVMIRRMPSRLTIGGLVVGLVGVAILLLPSEGIDAIDPIGIAIVVASALCWTAGSLYPPRTAAEQPADGLGHGAAGRRRA